MALPFCTSMSFRGSKATVGISQYNGSIYCAPINIVPGDCRGLTASQ